MKPFDPSSPLLAVTLVSASDPVEACRTAAALAGRPGEPVDGLLDLPGADGVLLAQELADELAREADAGRRGLSVVALDPHADPMEVALVLEHLCSRREAGEARIEILDVVSVTSVGEVLAELFGRRPQSAADPDPGSAERLAARLEFSSLIVLTGPAARRDEEAVVTELLHTLAPTARLVRAPDASRASHPLRPGLARALASSMGWQRALNGTSAPRTRSQAVREFVFRDPLPFHPGRLSDAVRDELVPDRVGRILRSRGLVRLATRADRVGSWSIAGDVLSLDPTTLLSWDSESPMGQEIAFFGIGLDTQALADVLGRCLLTPDELLRDPREWALLPDPFPAWTQEHRH